MNITTHHPENGLPIKGSNMRQTAFNYKLTISRF